MIIKIRVLNGKISEILIKNAHRFAYSIIYLKVMQSDQTKPYKNQENKISPQTTHRIIYESPCDCKRYYFTKKPQHAVGVFDLMLMCLTVSVCLKHAKYHIIILHHDGMNTVRPSRHDVNAHATHFFNAT